MSSNHLCTHTYTEAGGIGLNKAEQVFNEGLRAFGMLMKLQILRGRVVVCTNLQGIPLDLEHVEQGAASEAARIEHTQFPCLMAQN